MKRVTSWGAIVLLTVAVAACGGDSSGPAAPRPVDNDRDNDGIVNSLDACPDQAETVNNWADSDGCPDNPIDLYFLVRSDVETYWNQIFTSIGLVYTPISGFTPYTSPIQACGSTLGPNNAFYCTLDSGVFIHRPFMDELLSRVGDAAPAVVIAHEIGHHISFLDGIYVLLGLGLVTLKQVELQADCYAGAWAAWVANRGLLETGDLEEAVTLMIAIGDDTLGGPWFNPNGHGTAAQRTGSFLVGLLAGVAGCVDITQFPAASETGGQ